MCIYPHQSLLIWHVFYTAQLHLSDATFALASYVSHNDYLAQALHRLYERPHLLIQHHQHYHLSEAPLI
ncbi:conserved protein of unknown function [Ectopseudomonas oleovorans]|uniref:Uncharacterized protein n=1 Tax=Ectopseudomonas oleovorans TaxID=301 RepID=A0A653BCV3_ECTOL|nr:conserved protein of unknown function [Pseudomonas oleovorans]